MPEGTDHTASLPVTGAATERLPESIGEYRIVGRIGAGGMGSVFEAKQGQPQRTVALKVLHPGIASSELLRRFEVEAEVLGRLQHPGIAQIFEAGTFDHGAGPQPYFAMERIFGLPLDEHARSRELTSDDCLSLIARVCDAVHHAHQRGVIHRDLKPANILVDDAGQPKVLDFGVARVTDGDVQATTLQTDAGQLLGTIPYMSPEQAAGEPGELDTRSDVYALGVVAYELLVGSLPYDVRHRAIHDAIRAIREDDPRPLGTMDTSLRGDVEIIVGRALEKDKDRRYASASALAADIRRYLDSQPIVARPPTTWYQLRKFARRHRALVVGAAATLSALVVGLAGTIAFALAEADQRRLAEESETAAKLAKASAQREADRATGAERAERERATELTAVAAFQEARMGAIERQSMGDSIRRALVASGREALDEFGMSEEERRAETLALDQIVARINFTDVATATLESEIFGPTLESIREEFADQPLVRARLLLASGIAMRKVGLLEEARRSIEEAYAIRSDLLGDDDLETLDALHELAVLHSSEGDFTGAERRYAESLEGYRVRLGHDDPTVLQAESNLAMSYASQGRLLEAEAALRRVVERRRALFSDDDLGTLSATAALAHVLTELARPEEALVLSRAALEGRKRVLGPDHVSTIGSMSATARILTRLGEEDEARALYEAGLELCLAVHGTTHSQTHTLRNNLALLELNAGNVDLAEALLRDQVDAREEDLGELHPKTIKAVINLGSALSARGDLAGAEALMLDAYERARSALGLGSNAALDAVSWLAYLVSQQGRKQEAVSFFEASVEGLRLSRGDEHPETLKSVYGLGSVLFDLGRYEEASERYEEALEGREIVLGEDHIDTLRTLAALGRLRQKQGRLDDALPLQQDALARRQEHLGREHQHTIESRHDCAHTLLRLGRFAESEELAVQTYEDALEFLGPQHAETRATLGMLAQLYDDWHAEEPEAGYDALAAEWRSKR
ncbi:MAG: serine/threonine-protein kinase [Planctomycetota bacterium]